MSLTLNLQTENKDEKKNSIPQIWQELQELRELLKDFQLEDIKNYINEELFDSKNNIVELFEKDFSNIPKSDPFKKEVLITLAQMGITVYK